MPHQRTPGWKLLETLYLRASTDEDRRDLVHLAIEVVHEVDEELEKYWAGRAVRYAGDPAAGAYFVAMDRVLESVGWPRKGFSFTATSADEQRIFDETLARMETFAADIVKRRLGPTLTSLTPRSH